jgi:hypothetical protein
MGLQEKREGQYPRDRGASVPRTEYESATDSSYQFDRLSLDRQTSRQTVEQTDRLMGRRTAL